VAIIKSAIDNRCFQTSISGYYYTPVRPVFVGMLMMLSLGLIALRGLDIAEDILLNIAGMFALVVAVMPTTDVGSCAIVTPNVDPVVNGKLAPWVVANVDNNLWALMITGLIGVVATGLIGVLDARFNTTGSHHLRRRRSVVGLVVISAILIAAMLLYGATPERVRQYAHGWSATVMFLTFAAIAAYNSRTGRREQTYKTIYLVIAILMVVFGVVCELLLRSAHHQVLILEAGEITLFAVYWAVQTVENWASPNPRDPGRRGLGR
jgi:hypothetical protein